jgi:branched-chain amino acid transport system substrate-binding protein
MSYLKLSRFRSFSSRQTVVIGAVAVIAVMLSACGSGSGSTASGASSSSSSSSSSSVAAPSAAAIKLGFICSCSGAESAIFGDTEKVAQLWANQVNATGGINGSPVELFTMDDGTNPTTALQDAKTLVEQDHVIAMVGEASAEDGTWVPSVVKQGVPEVGGIDLEVVSQTPDYFGDGTTLPAQTVAMIDEAQGKKHIGLLYCAEIPSCAQVVGGSQKISQLFGLQFSDASVSATAPSYAAQCLQLKSEGVDALLIADTEPVLLRILSQCQQQGFTPLPLNTMPETTPAMLASPQLSGSLLASTDANIYTPSTPGAKEFDDAIDKAYPGLRQSSSFSYASVYPWIGGKLFEAAAKAANLGPSSTSADLIKGLYALKGVTLGGLTPPLTYTPGKPFFTPCWFTFKDESGTIVSLNQGKPVCLSSAKLAQLKPILLG